MKHIKFIFVLIVIILVGTISFFEFTNAKTKNIFVLNNQSSVDDNQEIQDTKETKNQNSDNVDTAGMPQDLEKKSANSDSSKEVSKAQSETTEHKTGIITSDIDPEYGLVPGIANVYTGDIQFISVYSRKNGGSVDLPFQWSVQGDTGEIIESNNGEARFKAENAGVCYVVASYNGKKYTAKINVIKKTGKINMTINGEGKVIKSPDKDTYEYGEIVTLTAVPVSGWGFYCWVFDRPFHSEYGNQIQVKFEETIHLYVNFARIVNFQDYNFESQVRSIINKQSGSILTSDIYKIQSLAITDSNISSLEGLQYFTGLQTITFKNNNITYIPDLNQLSILSYVDLTNNKIENISGLANLKSVKILYLNQNRIKDISPLKKLSSLQTLFLSGNEITDYTPIADYYSKLQDKDFTIP